MKTSLFLSLFAGSLLMGTTLYADTVELTDGTKLVGEITTITGNELTIKTKHCGEIKVSKSEVASYTSSEEVVVATKKGDKVSGIVSSENGKTQIKNQNLGSLTIDDNDFDRLWNAKLSDPADIPPPPATTWAYELAASMSGKTGNSESLAGDLRFQAVMKTDDSTFKLYAGGNYEKTDGNLANSKIYGGLDFEQCLGDLKRHSWYVRDEMQRDNVIEQDFRNVLAAGYGYYAFKNDRFVLRFRAGLGHTYEAYGEATIDDKSTLALDLGLHFQWTISDKSSWITDITYEPSLDDFTDCRIYHESKFRTKLAEFNNCSLEAGFSNEYYSVVNDGREYLDTNYFVRLVFGW